MFSCIRVLLMPAMQKKRRSRPHSDPSPDAGEADPFVFLKIAREKQHERLMEGDHSVLRPWRLLTLPLVGDAAAAVIESGVYMHLEI